MSELVFKNISKSFDGQSVIKAFDLAVPDGEFLVLLGPSGCGKSTLLRMIAGLESVSGGDILIDGQSVIALAPRERDVAMVFQNYALYPHMTVYDNIAFPLKMKRQKKEDIRQRVEDAAKLLGLTEMLSRKPKTLSGGQRQRVALGRALVREPKLFLFDEPLSNLDAKLRVSMRTEILRLMRSLKATVVYVTHDQEEALTMGDRIALLHDGIIQQAGTPQEIYDQPANTFVAHFIGTPRMNFVEAKAGADSTLVLADNVIIRGIEIPPPIRNQKLTLGFRPDNCLISDTEGMPVNVESTEYVGSSRYLYGKYGDQEIIVRVDPSTDVVPGSSIRITPQVDSAHLFDASGIRIQAD